MRRLGRINILVCFPFSVFPSPLPSAYFPAPLSLTLQFNPYLNPKRLTTLLPADRVYSAATSLPTPTSKPNPAIYIHAMKALSKQPSECLAVEDSKSGATAAFRANIKTIGYTGAYEPHEREKMEKVLRDAGCGWVMNDWTEFEGLLRLVEESGEGEGQS